MGCYEDGLFSHRAAGYNKCSSERGGGKVSKGMGHIAGEWQELKSHTVSHSLHEIAGLQDA